MLSVYFRVTGPVLIFSLCVYAQSFTPVSPYAFDGGTVSRHAAMAPATPAMLTASSDLVLINVSVLDRNGRPLRGLRTDSFHLFERRNEQTILSLSETETPVSVVIVFDESGSMQTGVARCAQAVKQFWKGASDADEFALITFSDQPDIDTDFTRDSSAIQTRLMEANSHGHTALLDALQSAAVLLKRAHNERRAIVVLSDGGENHSRRNERELRRTLLETAAQVYAVSIPFIGPGDATDAVGLLDRICGITGGRNVGIDNFSDLESAMQQINEEIRTEYVLGYKPQSLNHDGKFHPVRVKFTPPAGVRQVSVFWRPGYYDSVE
ncbi:MAG: VWA domain-containing protein [Bryobacteraceae bacterium]